MSSRHKLASEKVPKGKARFAAGGAVRRLVGSTYSAYIRQASGTVLVLLHHSEATAAAGYSPSDARFGNLVSEFYTLSKVLNGTNANMQFAQMDIRNNGLPGSLELADPKGMQLVLYLGSDATPQREP